MPEEYSYLRIVAYYKTFDRLLLEVGNYYKHWSLDRDLDSDNPSPDTKSVFARNHKADRKLLRAKLAHSKQECQVFFGILKSKTEELGKPFAESDKDGKNFLNALCLVGLDGNIDQEVARLRRERYRTIIRREIEHDAEKIKFYSPYDLEEEFKTYLVAREARLKKRKQKKK